MVRVVEDAKSHFPSETWAEIRYLGKLRLEHDIKIALSKDTHKRSFGALLSEKLIKRINKVKDSDGLMSLILGVTPDPIVAMHYFLDGGSFKRVLYLVHDYVTEKVGIVSLFRVRENDSTRVVAHGLGHNRGLRHHMKPIDLMYSELLKTSMLQVEGFCKVCRNKLESDINEVARKLEE
ncbi:MAG: hypothetical protein JSV51_02460 [Candidatus Bathyarchaeota archaeon]|nr:MAG: hypothetical protein JSV51_02460 [Candidatus Bathyarchaeota archaeon]